MRLIGELEMVDQQWRVEVGSVGSVIRYQLIGDGTTRNLPQPRRLRAGMTDVGINLGDLDEVEPAGEPR